MEALKLPNDSIDAMRQEFKKRRDLMMSALDKIPQIRYMKPDGAFYLFCDISKLKLASSEEFVKRILDDVKVALIPGEGFGAPQHIRLSFATSAERIQEGIKRIGEWVKKI